MADCGPRATLLLDPDGTVEIVDRTKDLVKSGGEWIRYSVETEYVVGHLVVEAAVICVPDPKWDRRGRSRS